MFYSRCLRISVSIVALFLIALPSLALQAELGYTTQQDTLPKKDLLENPRQAVHTFLYWQQEGHRRPELAIKTMQLARDASDEEKWDLATDLKRILDSRGLMVEYERIPGNPAYTDSLSGLHQYILFPSLPEVYLVRQNGQWMFSEATIEAIPELYADTFSMFVDLIVDELPAWMHQEWMELQVWQYFALFAWILIGLVFRFIFERLFDNYLHRLAARTQTGWDDRIFEEVEKPISFLVMMLFYWATFTNLQLPVSVNYYLSLALEIAVSASFVWLLYNLVNILSVYLMDLTSKTESKLDDQLVPLLRKTLKVFVVVLGIIFILQNNGINVTSLLAGLGLGGLAFALAARDTLANFFGSLTIFMDKPFQVGDWIKTSQAEGTVEEVGFRSTRIRTFHNSVVSIPNATLAHTEVDNMGLRQYRRFKTVLNLTYDTTPQQVEAFVEGIKAIVRANKHIRQDFYEVHFNNYGSHSLDVLVYIFFDVPDWSTELQQRHNFLLEVYRLAEKTGVEFAFPTQTLHVDSFYGETPRKAVEYRSEEELASTVYAFGPEGSLSKPEGVTLKKEGKEIDFGIGQGG